jgi:hypothetical protein
MADKKTIIEQAYFAFNQRDIDGALALMTEDVSWPKASEGGRIIGKEEIRAEVHPELINGLFAYVSVSRASHDAQVFTNNAENLAESLSKNVSKTSAMDALGKPVGQKVADLSLTINQKAGTGLGLSLSC